jgi:chemotaxis family two-component system response regulator Rcp1
MSRDRLQERSIHILLVEDNEADTRFFQEVLKSVPTPTVLHAVDDGQPALAFLRQQKEYGQAPIPDIVFLDSRLPVLSGPEVFVAMKQDRALAQIPVCLFVLDEYDLSLETITNHGFQVEGFLTKPVQAAQLTAILHEVRRRTFGATMLTERGCRESTVQDS